MKAMGKSRRLAGPTRLMRAAALIALIALISYVAFAQDNAPPSEPNAC